MIAISLFFLSCSSKEESCDDTIIPQHNVKFAVVVQVEKIDGTPMMDYPARYEIQKHFCDGDVGLRIYDEGFTDSGGEFSVLRDYVLPYTNEKDYVLVSFYCGPNYEYEYSRMYSYNEMKNLDYIICKYVFELP